MPRSGSELLNVILHQNPDIYGSLTSPLLEYQFAARGNYNLAEVKSQDPELMQKAFLAMCAGMAQSYYSAITDRPIVCDKNRGHIHYYEWIDQWNPNPKMICMVRDLRSIIASMERVFRKNRHSPEGPDNPSQLANMTTEDRIKHWLSTQPIGLALQRTLDCFQRGIDKNILFIRYEDLCANPQETMNGIYKYLDMPSFEHDFQNLTKEVAEDDSHFGIFGSHKVEKEIKPVLENSWSDVLNERLSFGIKQSFPWYFNAFNY